MNTPTIKEVEEWVKTLYDTCEESITPAERKEQRKYAIMVQRPQDKKFLVQMLDESSQIRDDKKLAKRIKTLIDEYRIPKFLNKRDTFLFEIYRQFGYIFWPIAIPIIKKRLRMDTSRVIIDAARPHLTKHLATRFDQKIGQNVNLLGEVVLGDEEADKRYYSYLEALKEPDNPSVEITVSRGLSESAAEVPITCEADDAFDVPETIRFEAGQDKTTLTIGTERIEASKVYTIKLSIDDKYADHYTILNGSTSCTFKVVKAQWKSYIDNVTMKWTTNGVENTWTTKIDKLGETDRYRILNLAGSGIDLYFNANTPSNGKEDYMRITPYYNVESYDYEPTTVLGYYFYDQANNDYPEWQVANGAYTVSYIILLEEYYGYGEYSFISFKKRDATIGVYRTQYNNNSSEYYTYIRMSWPEQ